MNPPAKKRGAGFWLLVGLGGIGACCVLPAVGLLLVGVFGALGTEAGAPQTLGGPVALATALAPSEADDFIYRAPNNGLEYIAPHRVAAEGVNVTLAGEWREDSHNIVLRLRDNGHYELTSSGAVLFGNSTGYTHADSSSQMERGAWSFEGGTLTLTPDAHELSATSGLQNLGTSKEKPDAARQWSIAGVTVAYTPHGETAERQRPGLHVVGPSPAWYYPSGTWDFVLRSAPWSG